MPEEYFWIRAFGAWNLEETEISDPKIFVDVLSKTGVVTQIRDEADETQRHSFRTPR